LYWLTWQLKPASGKGGNMCLNRHFQAVQQGIQPGQDSGSGAQS
jgi:hypothetical protein